MPKTAVGTRSNEYISYGWVCERLGEPLLGLPRMTSPWEGRTLSPPTQMCPCEAQEVMPPPESPACCSLGSCGQCVAAVRKNDSRSLRCRAMTFVSSSNPGHLLLTFKFILECQLFFYGRREEIYISLAPLLSSRDFCISSNILFFLFFLFDLWRKGFSV